MKLIVSMGLSALIAAAAVAAPVTQTAPETTPLRVVNDDQLDLGGLLAWVEGEPALQGHCASASDEQELQNLSAAGFLTSPKVPGISGGSPELDPIQAFAACFASCVVEWACDSLSDEPQDDGFPFSPRAGCEFQCTNICEIVTAS